MCSLSSLLMRARPAVSSPNSAANVATSTAGSDTRSDTSAIVALLVGGWFLWADLVPALGVLNDVKLWNTTEMQTVEITAPDGATQVPTFVLASNWQNAPDAQTLFPGEHAAPSGTCVIPGAQVPAGAAASPPMPGSRAPARY